MKQKRNTALIDDDTLAQVILRPDPTDPRLTRVVESMDQHGQKQQTRVIVERPLTIYLNETEIVTAMTIGDHPEVLAVGYLINQLDLRAEDSITSVEYEDDIDVVVVRTAHPVAFQNKLKKRTLTSGCAQGTVFGDMDALQGVELPEGPTLFGPPSCRHCYGLLLAFQVYILRQVRSMVAPFVPTSPLCCTWRMLAVTMPSIKLLGTCT